jgi:hypothetical protein
VNDIRELARDSESRRAFLARMGAAGLGAAAAALLASPPGMRLAAQNGGGNPAFPGIPGRDVNEVVLNFALTLENLEADLYRQALNKATGKPPDTPLASFVKADAVYVQTVDNDDLPAQLARDGFLYLKQFTYVEAAHRDFLSTTITALGGTPVPPNPKGYQFATPLGDDLEAILSAILPLEETGVRAYLGALPFVTDLQVIAPTAGGIFSTEARHSAVINYVLGMDPGPRRMRGDHKVTPRYPSPNTFEYFLPPAVVLRRVQPMIIQ